jgi:hypothetical protein
LDHAHIVLAQVETAVMGMCEQPFQPPLRIASRRVRLVPFLEQRHLPIQGVSMLQNRFKFFSNALGQSRARNWRRLE